MVRRRLLQGGARLLVRVQFLVIGAMVAGCHLPRPAGTGHFAAYERSATRIQLPFVVYAHDEAREVFGNPRVGLKLESVLADGKRIAGVPTPIDFDEEDYRPVTLTEGLFAFVLLSEAQFPHENKPWDFLTLDFFVRDDWGYVTHSVPKGTRAIEIHYRVRFTDLTLGPLLVLKAQALAYDNGE